MTYKPKNILVTGGAGFIGSNYARFMLSSDPDVRIVNLDLLTYAGSLDNLKDLPDASRHRFVQGDICDRGLIDRLLHDHEIDTIVHFAAESHVDNSISGPEVFVKTNVMGTFTLLEAAKHNKPPHPISLTMQMPHLRALALASSIQPLTQPQ